MFAGICRENEGHVSTGALNGSPRTRSVRVLIAGQRRTCETWTRSPTERAPSPNYNRSILEDMFVEEHGKFLRDATGEVEYLEDACLLLKVWAARRGMLGRPRRVLGVRAVSADDPPGDNRRKAQSSYGYSATGEGCFDLSI